MNIIVGLIILGIVYGAFNALMGALSDDYDEERILYGARILAASLCALMAFGAIVLIFFGGGKA